MGSCSGRILLFLGIVGGDLGGEIMVCNGGYLLGNRFSPNLQRVFEYSKSICSELLWYLLLAVVTHRLLPPQLD